MQRGAERSVFRRCLLVELAVFVDEAVARGEEICSILICLLVRLGRYGAFAAASAGGFVVSAAKNVSSEENHNREDDDESGDALPICGKHSGQ